jgi:hypothetical protein
MNSETTTLIKLPWIERTRRLKELGKEHSTFRSFRRHFELLRLVIVGLLAFLFYSLRDHFGLYAFIGYVVTCWLVDCYMERWLVIPCANLHMEIQKQAAPSDGDKRPV